MKRYIILAVLFAILIGTGLAQNAATGDVKAFQQALEKDGFTVQKGGLGFFDAIKLHDLGILPSTYGNNPATKYLTYFVPPASGHNVPEQFSKIANAIGLRSNLSSFWNLGPDEAVVFVGRTPPDCTYFSYDHYVVDRTFGNETRWIFANIADKGIDQRIRAAALSAGYSGDIFNTQVLPSAMLNMGLENNSDTFAVIIRPALFKDKQAGDNYINNTPATVFRITPNESTKLDPYSYPKLRVRGTGKTEFDLIPDLEQLREAILKKYSGLNTTELPTSIPVPVGSDAIQRGIDALIPNNDACYLWTVNQIAASPTPSFPNLSLYYPFVYHPAITLSNDTNDFIIVYGVNHAATGKATYENFAVYGADIFNGVGAISDTDFNGTAEEYLPNNPNAKYLYVYKVARNCNGDAHCFKVPYGLGSYGIHPNQPIYIWWRLYLEKATQTGPSYSEIVYDRAIKFDPKKQG